MTRINVSVYFLGDSLFKMILGQNIVVMHQEKCDLKKILASRIE